mgnify:CR=1 FL=1
MISRDEALKLVKKHIKNKNLQKHMIAVEGVMRRLAREFGEDEEVWGITGLLHDLDYDLTADDFPRHGYTTTEMLQGEDVTPDMLQAIICHPGHCPAESKLEQALYAADPVTGLIVAAVLMHPEKSLKAVDVDFLERRFKEKRFAAGADRDQIASCERLGISLPEFFQMSLEGMRDRSDELGLG